MEVDRARIYDATDLLVAAQRIDQYAALREADPALRAWYGYWYPNIDTVYRARNNIVFHHWISDRNLAAAAKIAKRIVEMAELTLEHTDGR